MVLFTDFRKAYYSVGTENVTKISQDFGIPAQLVKLVRVAGKQTKSNVKIIGKTYCRGYWTKSKTKTKKPTVHIAFKVVPIRRGS